MEHILYCTYFDKFTEKDCGCENCVKKEHEVDLSSERFDDAEKDLKYIIDHIDLISE